MLSASMPADVSGSHSSDQSTDPQSPPPAPTSKAPSGDPDDGTSSPPDSGKPSDSGGNPGDPGSPPSSGGDTGSPPNSGGQADPGAFLPDPNFAGAEADAPLVSQDQFNGYLKGVEGNLNSSWVLSQQETIKRVGSDSALMTANLNQNQADLLKQIDDRIVELVHINKKLAQLNIWVADIFVAEANRFAKMTPEQQNSAAGRNTLLRMKIEETITDRLVKAIDATQNDIDFLKQERVKVKNAFDKAVASIRKDYSTSGGPGHEIYQNDDFYFV